MSNNSYSLDLSKVKGELKRLKREHEQQADRMQEIYRRAVIKNTSVAQAVVEVLEATPADLRMLSKVFERLSVLVAEQDELGSRITALEGLENKSEWLYQVAGDTSKDLDHFLNTTIHAKENINEDTA